jgi:bacteriocin-like protein
MTAADRSLPSRAALVLGETLQAMMSEEELAKVSGGQTELCRAEFSFLIEVCA